MHLEALKSEQKEIFKRLRQFPEYYLAGGTALALQIGHRISVDFDFFTSEEIPKSLLAKIKRIFRGYEFKIEINNPEQLTIELNGAGLTFVKYPFPLLFKLKGYQGVKLLSVKEIGTTKAFALGQRATLKDYIDIYFILKENYASLEELIKISKRKFKDEFNQRLFLEQSIYLEDVEDVPIEFLREKPTKVQIQKFFEKEVAKLKI